MGSEKKIQGSGGKRSLVKCLICGEIFDASLEICPVCGVGTDFFVPYEEEVTNYVNNTDETILILGNGVAALSAAETIRERNKTCRIIMISKESVCSYNRTMLTKSLMTLKDAEDVFLHDKVWYEENHIEYILDKTVVNLEINEKSITLSGGLKLEYDKCIYALGADCFIPPIAGGTTRGVIAIRNIDDVKEIQARMSSVKHVVVVGGGVLGLETAWELSKCAQVTVLEVANKLMVRQLDDTAGELLADLIRSAGIQFQVNADIIEITGDENVTGVKLRDGDFYPADLVIVSCGIQPNAAIAREAGLRTERAVVVDDRMKTSCADVFACGDCAQYNGINYAIWPEAVAMGKVAGANAAGDSLIYEVIPPALTFEGMNTTLFSIGDIGRNSDIIYKEQEYKDIDKKTYRKYYFAEDKMVGAILIGDTSDISDLTEAIKEGRNYNEMKLEDSYE